jgi:glycosyltransferase involved in cell wall biosynthesis
VKVEKTLGCFEDTVDTKTGKTQSKLNYWRPETFPYIDKYLGIFSEEKKIEFLNDRRKGYAMMQAHMNSLSSNVSNQIQTRNLPMISVIIPTYNCREYVCRAIDSVLAQGLDNFEVIVVDDASSDGTQEVLNVHYKMNSHIIKIVHPKNLKLGGARNTGLDAAKGKYIFFLDADDWLENGSLARLASVAEEYKAEIVACGVNRVWPKARKEKYHSEAFACAGGTEALNHLADYLIGSIVWNKIYLRSFIEEHKLRFVPGFFHEDVMFTTNAIYLCKKYISINDLYYNYFQRDASIVNSKPTELHLRSYIRLYIDMSDFLERNQICKGKEGKNLCQAILRAHCSNEVFPKLIHYMDTRTREEWEHECKNACVAEFGAKGYAVANFVIEAMRNIKRHVPIIDDQVGRFSLRRLIKKHFGFIVYGRFRRLLRRIYYLLGLDMLK